MDRHTGDRIKTAYFMIVAVLMYYFITQAIAVGLVITHRHFFALVLFASWVVVFLYKPNVARGTESFRSSLVYSTPLLIITLVSLFIWFVGTADVDVITRGLSTSFIYTNMLSAALASGAMLYVFGEKGIWYNLIAILISNMLMILTIIAQYGLGSFMSEFITLVVTFAAETGDIIINAEIHELAFCLGAYIIYMLYKPKKNIVFFILLALAVFCFTTAFKRIGIIAIAVALVFGYFLRFVARYNEKTAAGLTMFFTLLTVGLLIGYIALIKADAFELLEKAGINTSGRVEIYNAVDKFYEFRPGFLGNGIGFLTYQLNNFMRVGVASVHNDFLQHFIDLGFWGYIMWLLSMTVLRVWYFRRRGNVDNGIICFMLILYLIVVSSTDNTMNYPLLTGVLALIMMGDGYDERVRKTEERMFGYISEENREGSESLL